MSKEKKTDSFGKRLAALRNRVKLKKTEFAVKIGINGASLITSWESGDGYPSCEILKNIGEVFQVDIHELLLGDPSPTVRKEVEALREVKASFRGLLLDVRGRIEQFKKIDKQIAAVTKDIETFIKSKECNENGKEQ